MSVVPVVSIFDSLDSDNSTTSRRRAARIAAFQPAFRKRIERFTARSAALEDLADSFPALLFALATGPATSARRARVIAAIESGMPLRQAAGMLELPWWLRRLPAAAFDQPLDGLPDDNDFALRISPFIPSEPTAARLWLRAVAFACRACHADYGLWVASWIAKQPGLLAIASGNDNVRLLAAWAWAADHPRTPLHALLRRRWTPTMSPRRAFDELAVWRQRIELSLLLSARPPVATLEPDNVLGFDFVPLVSAADFISEATAMDNCLDQYAERLARRGSRIFAIRENGRSVADIEIGVHDEEPTMPAIRQLRGPRNRRAAPEVWRAAYTWLGAQPLRPASAGDGIASASALRAAANEFWQSYIADRARSLTPSDVRTLVHGAGTTRRDVSKAGARPARQRPSRRPRGGASRPGPTM